MPPSPFVVRLSLPAKRTLHVKPWRFSRSQQVLALKPFYSPQPAPMDESCSGRWDSKDGTVGPTRTK